MQVQSRGTSSTEIEKLTLHFSNERTLLAWIRAATALLGFGYAVARFALYLDERSLGGGASRVSATYAGGFAMTVAGLLALVLASLRYRANARGIDMGSAPRTHEAYVYTFASLVALSGLLLVILLLELGQ